MEQENISPRKIIFSVIYLFSYPILLLALAGNLHWIEGWIYNTWFILSSVFTLIYLYLKDPTLLTERYKKLGTGNQKKWDKYFILLLISTYLLWFMIMPLDAERFHWTINFPLWLKYSGGICLLISYFFTFRSFADNTFASYMIRIQTERKQHVISTGVYAFVRHPMYLGAILMFLGVPMLLGSKYGILLGIFLSLIFAFRIIGEEKMLTEELEGYSDYKKKVKYRLLPYIW